MDWVDNLQLGLSGAGLVPALGAIPDVISAGVSVVQGDYVGAGLSIVGIIPFVGDGALVAKGVRIAAKLSKEKHAAEGTKTFITYMIKNEDKVVYVGRASGKGSPEQVLNLRVSRGHDHFHPETGDTIHVVGVQSNKAANAGAEDVLFEHQKLQGANLRNIDPPLSTRSSRINNTRQKIQAYSDDLRGK